MTSLPTGCTASLPAEARRKRLYEQKAILMAEIDRINDCIYVIEHELDQFKAAYLDRVE